MIPKVKFTPFQARASLIHQDISDIHGFQHVLNGLASGAVPHDHGGIRGQDESGKLLEREDGGMLERTVFLNESDTDIFSWVQRDYHPLRIQKKSRRDLRLLHAQASA
jgi:hypothetical protein